MNLKRRWLNTCDQCGQIYHISSECYCQLEDHWRRMAAYHQREAQRCLQTAELLAAEKAKPYVTVG